MDEFAASTSSAAIVTSSSPVELLNFDGLAVPSKKPTDVFISPVPLMKSVNESLPAVMSPGESVAINGVGEGRALLEQPANSRLIAASRASELHRKRFKQLLLKSFRSSRRRPGPADWNARKTEATSNSRQRNHIELIASTAKAVNSDSEAAGMVGSVCDWRTGLSLKRTNFAVQIKRREPVEQVSLLLCGDIRVEINYHGACGISMGLPTLSHDS